MQDSYYNPEDRRGERRSRDRDHAVTLAQTVAETAEVRPAGTTTPPAAPERGGAAPPAAPRPWCCCMLRR